MTHFPILALLAAAILLASCGGGGSATIQAGTPVLNVSIATDTSAPELSFAPASITLADGMQASVVLSAADNVGITAGPDVSCGNDVQFDAQMNILSAPLAQTKLQTVCTATASDLAGNVGNTELQITIIPALTDAPAVDISSLFNYADQPVPDYILQDNTPAFNLITDAGATLGRVLFYDANLSVDNSVSCASCHHQELAFSDAAVASSGVNGLTERHSMRLLNLGFAEESRVFWDKRAESVEDQTSHPIQSIIEMGFSGQGGAPGISDLLLKLELLPYYHTLFTLAFGDPQITEARIQSAIGQFVRSIQGFQSRYDEGMALVGGDHDLDFPNFTADENAGKQLFTQPYLYDIESKIVTEESGSVTRDVARRLSGGLNCAACHRPPEFDIDPDSLNNGVTTALQGSEPDTAVVRAPTLRNVLREDGLGRTVANGGLFHDGQAAELFGDAVIRTITDHYDLPVIHSQNENIDPRLLRPVPGPGMDALQFLDMTDDEVRQLEAFLKTLDSPNIYTAEKWSDPFTR